MMGWVILPTELRIRRRSHRHLFWLPLVLLLTFLCSCGGSSTGQGDPKGTPAGTYTLTVTATVGSTKEQVPLTLKVQ